MSENDQAAKAVIETAKAAQEVAKTTGKGIDAGLELGGFFARFTGGPLEQASGIVEDKLRYMRWERQVRLMSAPQTTIWLPLRCKSLSTGHRTSANYWAGSQPPGFPACRS